MAVAARGEERREAARVWHVNFGAGEDEQTSELRVARLARNREATSEVRVVEDVLLLIKLWYLNRWYRAPRRAVLLAPPPPCDEGGGRASVGDVELLAKKLWQKLGAVSGTSPNARARPQKRCAVG